MNVWAVIMEGEYDDIDSLWTTEDGATAEVDRLNAVYSTLSGMRFHVEKVEVHAD